MNKDLNKDYNIEEYKAKNLHLALCEMISDSDDENGKQIANACIDYFGEADAILFAPDNELIKVVGELGAKRIKAARWLAQEARMSTDRKSRITKPEDAASIARWVIGDNEMESMMVIVLNMKCGVISYDTIYIGNVDTVIMKPCEVMRHVIKAGGQKFIVVHNHPSGDPTPSPEDVELTTILINASDMLGLEMMDHIVIGTYEYKFCSIRELKPEIF